MRAREVSPVEVVEAHLRAIEKHNHSLNAIVTIADDAVDQARARERELTRSADCGPLHGLPVTIKDTIDTAGLRTTSGSRMRRDYVPEADAPVVARLKAAGAIILGKTNVPEMAIPYECDNPVFGRSNNPHDLERTPGGSSGGEAAAIAAGLSPAGLGSDLSGSIRVPAHFCGIAGLKPTAGRVPMDGHTPPASGVVSLGATIGPMARTVADLALLFEVIANPAATSAADPANDSMPVRSVSGVRLAWYADDGITPVSDEIQSAVTSAAKVFAAAGVDVVKTTPPPITQGTPLWIKLFAHAANSEIASLYRGREDEAGPQVARLLREFADTPLEFEDRIISAEHLAEAVIERERLREELLRWMKTTPLILAPVGATIAFEHGRARVNINDQYTSVFRAFSYAQVFNVFGFPVVAVPVGRTGAGLPIGVQIVGRPFAERTILAAAAIIEQTLGDSH